MDSSSEDGEGRNPHHVFRYQAAQHRVEYDKPEEFNKKRYPICHSSNNPGRVKRVVSCKRKTHHLTVVRRKQLGCGRNSDAANKENEIKRLQNPKQGTFFVDQLEFPPDVSDIGNITSEQMDYYTLNELCRDHRTMTDVLFGRNLRLKVALTLWQRNVGELLTYFLKIQDTGVIVDFLPLLCKCIDEDSPRINIGCCVDLFPLVRKVLSKPYEEYLIVGLKWIHSVLKNWWQELGASGFSGSTQPQLDENLQVFNQQLWELWHQEPFVKRLPVVVGDMAKVVETFLLQLN